MKLQNLIHIVIGILCIGLLAPTPEVKASATPATTGTDDATIKQKLIGTWQAPGQHAHQSGNIKFPEIPPTIIVLKEDGVKTSTTGNEATYVSFWEIRNGVYHTWKLGSDGQPRGEGFFKIISLTKNKVVMQDMYHGRNTGEMTRVNNP